MGSKGIEEITDLRSVLDEVRVADDAVAWAGAGLCPEGTSCVLETINDQYMSPYSG